MSSPSAKVAIAVAFAWIGSAEAFPRYLTWRELQIENVSTRADCPCATTHSLEHLVIAVGSKLCLPRPDRGVDVGNISLNDPEVCYPVDYGVGYCRMWDAGVGDCASETPSPYCFHHWCYVDPDECDTGDVTESAFFSSPSGGPFFSYQTCGLPIGNNPYYKVTIPTHRIVISVLLAVGIPGIMHFAIRRAIKRLQFFKCIKGPLMLLAVIITVSWCHDVLLLQQRIPNFPAAESVTWVLESLTLGCLLLIVSFMLRAVNDILRSFQFESHASCSARREVCILKSVLMKHGFANENTWEDLLVGFLWNGFYSFAQLMLCVVWLLLVLDFPILSGIATSGFLGSSVLVVLIGTLTIKADIMGAIAIGVTKPFRVGDIVSIHAMSNADPNPMSAIAVGFVEKLGLLHVTIRNFDMRRQVVPTHAFLQLTVRNWSVRPYRMHQWRLHVSTRTPATVVGAFRSDVEKVIKSHPGCKTDGYLVATVKNIKGGGYFLDVICYSTPRQNHHAFKTEISLQLGQLAARHEVPFVFEEITRECNSRASENYYDSPGPEPKTDDLLFAGQGVLTEVTWRMHMPLWLGVSGARGPYGFANSAEGEPDGPMLSSNLAFTMQVDHPSFESTKKIRWKKDHPALKGLLTLFIDQANHLPMTTCKVIDRKKPRLSQRAMSRSISKSSSELVHRVAISAPFSNPSVLAVANVVRRTSEAGDIVLDEHAAAEMALGHDASALTRQTGLQSLLSRTGDEVLAFALTSLKPLSPQGQVSWGETVEIGEVGLDFTGQELILQVFVASYSKDHVTVFGVMEEPLMRLMDRAWADQKVTVETVKD